VSEPGTPFARRRYLIGGLALGLVLVALLAPIPLAGPAPQERHVSVSARTFEFDPSIVRVNRGDTVLIKLQSEDVVHGLYVDGYGVSTQAEPGRPGELRFVADRAGAFHIRCAVPCGNLHPFMIGKLVVGPNLTLLRAVAASVIAAVGALAALWRP
jgi:heme/copper-type cytochrome/quinol oxidase subunit 2